MTLTQKEKNFLKDLQSEEKLCIDKYHKAAENACDPTLKQLFNQIEGSEQHHYDVVSKMMQGEVPVMQNKSNKSQSTQPQDLKSKASRAEKEQDQYLLSDLLATEKYVAGAYNTAVFEFNDEQARQTLSAIQQQEQHHGKQLSEYMQANNMYC